jgi:hypothetical protein
MLVAGEEVNYRHSTIRSDSGAGAGGQRLHADRAIGVLSQGCARGGSEGGGQKVSVG